MIIRNVINNNVVSAYDEEQHEVILMGKGLGFQKKPGQEVVEDRIEKRFALESKAQLNRFEKLVESIPMDHLKVSMDIIEYAVSVMPKRLGKSIYISLTDHINFALQRSKDGMFFENPLINEIKSFYPSEYLIGEYGLALIRKETGVNLPVDEAASIALHFVNAEYNVEMSDTMHITTLISEALEIVEEDLGIKLNEMGLYYSRFVTHLKFLAQRIFTGQLMKDTDRELTDMICKLYPREFEISKKICDYIEERYEHVIPREELAYLTVHIRRVQPDVPED